MDLISSAFIVMGLAMIGCAIAIVVIIVRVARSVEIGDQLMIPFTADDYMDLDTAVWRAAREREQEMRDE